jgi:glutathione peroxidase
MKTSRLLATALATLTGAATLSLAQPESKPAAKPATDPAAADPAYVLGYSMNDIDGKPVDLASFKGKVLLIVNVASNCGFTSQYSGLEKLYKDKHDKGFEILAFPANDFMGQEPGTNAEIKTFCTTKYNVTFPIFSKISVKGEKQHPLYKQIASLPKPVGEEPGWNFTKYLVDRSGRVVARFGPRVTPDDKDLLARLNELLESK